MYRRIVCTVLSVNSSHDVAEKFPCALGGGTSRKLLLEQNQMLMVTIALFLDQPAK